jgi:hypothetical protein
MTIRFWQHTDCGREAACVRKPRHWDRKADEAEKEPPTEVFDGGLGCAARKDSLILLL